jgi:DNA polymerase-4
MVGTACTETSGELLWLFVDMNSYFASVEQQFRPELRGRPVAVVPVMAESTCCIAASYEAKRFGIKTGTNVAEARRLCPGLQVIHARPPLYVRTHHEILEAVDSVLPVEEVLSVDEMYCRLGLSQREPEPAMELGMKVKRAVKRRVGESLLCSVGLAPNRFLAKVAGEMQKPDGLTVVTLEDLPHKLYSLTLRDLPGIGRRMDARLERHGVRTVEQLCSLPKDRLREIWEGVLGERWWHALRGEEPALPPTRRRSVGHSHVLPPEFRTPDGALSVLIRLVHKAAARLRGLEYCAGGLALRLSYTRRERWKTSTSFAHCQDTQTMVRILCALWRERPEGGVPLKVSVVLYDLIPDTSMTLSLFPEHAQRLRLTQAMDDLNQRFGNNAVYLAAMHDSRRTAPMRIAFNHVPDETFESDGPDPEDVEQIM